MAYAEFTMGICLFFFNDSMENEMRKWALHPWSRNLYGHRVFFLLLYQRKEKVNENKITLF